MKRNERFRDTNQTNNVPGLQQAEGDQVVGPDDAGPELQRDSGEGGQRMGAAAGKDLILNFKHCSNQFINQTNIY